MSRPFKYPWPEMGCGEFYTAVETPSGAVARAARLYSWRQGGTPKFTTWR